MVQTVYQPLPQATVVIQPPASVVVPSGGPLALGRYPTTVRWFDFNNKLFFNNKLDNIKSTLPCTGLYSRIT